MYTFTYGYGERKDEAMLFDVRMYELADRFLIPTLKEVAKDRIIAAVGKLWESTFAPVIGEIYRIPPTIGDGLRKVVTIAAHENIVKLMEKEDFLQVLREIPDFSLDLTRRLVDGAKPTGGVQNGVKCWRCNRTWRAMVLKALLVYCPHCDCNFKHTIRER